MGNETVVLNPKQVAEICHVSLRLIYRLLKRNEIEHCKAGDKYLVSVKSLEKFLSGQSNQPPAGPATT